MKRRTKKAAFTPYIETEKGRTEYLKLKARSQAEADADGYDRGIECLGDGTTFAYIHTFMLPAKQFRQGFELRCQADWPLRKGLDHAFTERIHVWFRIWRANYQSMRRLRAHRRRKQCLVLR
jgi:hypothetical protein